MEILPITLMLIICFAGFAQGLTGFGFSLIAFPLLTIFLQVKQITPILIVLSIITNIMVILSSKNHYKLRDLWLLIIFGVLATPIGAYILKIVQPNILKAIVGVIISLTAFFLLMNYKLKIKHLKFSQAITGIFSGILNGSLSLSGPPIILYMSNQGAKKDELRGSFSLFALITNIFAVSTMYFANLINLKIYSYLYLFSPALVIGVYCGIRVSKKVNEQVFQKITLYLLIIMGVWTFFSSGLL
jgi:uncharacterized protein